MKRGDSVLHGFQHSAQSKAVSLLRSATALQKAVQSAGQIVVERGVPLMRLLRRANDSDFMTTESQRSNPL